MAHLLALMLTITQPTYAVASETWCWSENTTGSRSCVYDRKQCEDIVRLRGRGMCSQPTDRRFTR